jgi:hypothetical protein
VFFPNSTNRHTNTPHSLLRTRDQSTIAGGNWAHATGGSHIRWKGSLKPKREGMKDTYGRQHPDAGSRYAERRAAPRFELVAPVEITEPISKTYTEGRVVDVSQHGCFAEVVSSLTKNSIVQLRIRRDEGAFETWARVVYNRPDIGLGLFFINTTPDQGKLLASWLVGLKEIG